MSNNIPPIAVYYHLRYHVLISIAIVEAIRASGMAKRRLAKLDFKSSGPAASAPQRATNKPVPLTKSI